MAVAQIVAVMTGDSSEVHQHVPGATWVLSDAEPYLRFAVSSAVPVLQDGHEKYGELKSEGGYDEGKGQRWWRWYPLKGQQMAEQRRFGTYALRIKSPVHDTLRCYLLPSKVIGISQLSAILQDIEEELGFSIIWDADGRSAVRTWATEELSFRSTVDQLMASVDEELVAVAALERAPYAELGPYRPGQDWTHLPERAIISAWSARRSASLYEASRRLVHVLTELQSLALAQSNNNKRRDEHLSDAKHVVKQIDRLETLSARVHRVVAIHGIGSETGFALSPAIQRDWRLRRLLRAFMPNRQEKMAWQTASLSSLPPLRATDLFELWAAVQVARWLRLRGYSGSPPTVRGASGAGEPGMIAGCTWVLSSGAVTIRLDHEPEPVPLVLATAPPPHLRDATSWHSASANAPHTGFDTLVSKGAASPDLAIRLSGPGGRALAVGDASLADHEWQDGRKLSTTARYRETVAWWVDMELVRCHPVGSFVVLPGPTDRWAALDSLSAEEDAYVICPTPLTPCADAEHRFHHLLSRLLRSVGA